MVIGCPSMLKSPSCGSSRASITSTIVVLPLPVAPTKPTVQCAGIAQIDTLERRLRVVGILVANLIEPDGLCEQ